MKAQLRTFAADGHWLNQPFRPKLRISDHIYAEITTPGLIEYYEKRTGDFGKIVIPRGGSVVIEAAE